MTPAECSPLPQQSKTAGYFAKIGWPLISLIVLVGAIGIAMLYSAAGGDLEPWAGQHAVRLAAGIVLILLLSLVPLSLWLRLAYPVYAVTLVAIVLVALVGAEAMGARRWLRLGDFSLQPSELMKLALVLALARYYQWLPSERVGELKWMAPPLAMIGVPVALVMRQPDLGTAVLFAGVGLGVMAMAGVRLRHLAIIALAVASLAPILWWRLHDYQRQRIWTFLDPERDPLGAGYHILQSRAAFSAGGLFGTGFMAGNDTRLRFLPEKQTDFIFAVIGEEGGFAATMTIVVLYGIMVTALLLMASHCRNHTSRLLIGGTALMVSIYSLVNMAMVVGLVPVVGVPLPLVSYGGTAMLTLLAAFGIAMSAYVHRHDRIRRQDISPLL